MALDEIVARQKGPKILDIGITPYNNEKRMWCREAVEEIFARAKGKDVKGIRGQEARADITYALGHLTDLSGRGEVTSAALFVEPPGYKIVLFQTPLSDGIGIVLIKTPPTNIEHLDAEPLTKLVKESAKRKIAENIPLIKFG